MNTPHHTTTDTTASTTTDTTASTAGRSSLWQTLRDEMRARRAARAAYRRMVRDLAPYESRTDIEDLLAAVDRHESPEAEQMRGILHAKLAHAARSNVLAA